MGMAKARVARTAPKATSTLLKEIPKLKIASAIINYLK
jgi:hypothetical protein